MDEQLIEKVESHLRRSAEYGLCSCGGVTCAKNIRDAAISLVAILSPEPAKAPEEVVQAMQAALLELHQGWSDKLDALRALHAQEIERLGRERGEALSAPEIDGRERSEYMRRIRENRPLDALMYFLRDRRAALNAKKVPTLGQQIDDILEDHWGKSDSHRDKAIIAIVELVQRRAEGSTK